MFRTLALALTLGSLALPAAAASVKVNVSGLDAEAAHQRIVKAAESVCRTALDDQPSVTQYYLMGGCVADAVAEADAKLAKMYAAK